MEKCLKLCTCNTDSKICYTYVWKCHNETHCFVQLIYANNYLKKTTPPPKKWSHWKPEDGCVSSWWKMGRWQSSISFYNGAHRLLFKETARERSSLDFSNQTNSFMIDSFQDKIKMTVVPVRMNRM
jgi:hypothetical protein